MIFIGLACALRLELGSRLPTVIIIILRRSALTATSQSVPEVHDLESLGVITALPGGTTHRITVACSSEGVRPNHNQSSISITR